jgi:D-lactate dehydrogenase
MAMLQTINRRIHKAYNRIKEYNFSLNGLTGVDLYNKTIGVIGTGKIGKVFINICKGYGMNILAFDKYPDPNLDVEYVELDRLFKESDFISLHCPLTEETTYIINKKSIALMKKGVGIINTSRGALINANDLLNGIRERKIGFACLDVYEEEGDIFYEDKSGHIMDDNILLQLIAMPNVLITSHQAFLTEEALNNIAETTTNNILNFFNDASSNETEICYHCGHQGVCQKQRKNKCF